MTNDHDDRLPDGTVIRVTAGSPSADETAAVVAALEAAGTPSARSDRPRSNWMRAARREAAGHRLIASPTDLR